MQPRKGRVRRGWMLTHRWLGLTLGLVMALLGLTGSINVFTRERDAALNPTLATATASANDIGASAALRFASAAIVEPMRFVQAPDPVWTALFRRDGRFWTMSIDLGTSTALGLRNLDRSLLRLVCRRHVDLLLERWCASRWWGFWGWSW